MAQIDLFDLALESSLDFLLDFLPAVGSIIRVARACYRCSQRDEGSIGNRQANYLECSNCHAQVTQYTNACRFTVNKFTGQIGHAAHVPAGKKWTWRGDDLYVPFYIKAKGLKGRSLVLETKISEFSSGRQLTSHSSILNPSYDTSVWESFSHIFGEGNFKSRNEKILAVDGVLRSEYRDVVFEDRRLIEPWE